MPTTRSARGRAVGGRVGGRRRGRFVAAGRAVRAWALPTRTSTPSSTVRPSPATPRRKTRSTPPRGRPWRCSGSSSTPTAGLVGVPTGLKVGPGLAADLDGARAAADIDIPDAVLVRAIAAWTQLFGLVSFELFGQTPTSSSITTSCSTPRSPRWPVHRAADLTRVGRQEACQTAVNSPWTTWAARSVTSRAAHVCTSSSQPHRRAGVPTRGEEVLDEQRSGADEGSPGRGRSRRAARRTGGCRRIERGEHGPCTEEVLDGRRDRPVGRRSPLATRPIGAPAASSRARRAVAVGLRKQPARTLTTPRSQARAASVAPFGDGNTRRVPGASVRSRSATGTVRRPPGDRPGPPPTGGATPPCPRRPSVRG